MVRGENGRGAEESIAGARPVVDHRHCGSPPFPRTPFIRLSRAARPPPPPRPQPPPTHPQPSDPARRAGPTSWRRGRRRSGIGGWRVCRLRPGTGPSWRASSQRWSAVLSAEATAFDSDPSPAPAARPQHRNRVGRMAAELAGWLQTRSGWGEEGFVLFLAGRGNC